MLFRRGGHAEEEKKRVDALRLFNLKGKAEEKRNWLKQSQGK